MSGDWNDTDERAARIDALIDETRAKLESAREKAERASDEGTAEVPEVPEPSVAPRKKMAKAGETAADADEQKKA